MKKRKYVCVSRLNDEMPCIFETCSSFDCFSFCPFDGKDADWQEVKEEEEVKK